MLQVFDFIERTIFGHRRLVIAIFFLVSAGLAISASQITVDAGFEKTLPWDHPMMQVFGKHQDEFGNANRLLISVEARSGDIFSAPFLDTLHAVTDEVFFLPGVNKASVQSLFTPNVRFIEVVEGGFTGGDVVPADYQGTDEDLDAIRTNVFKAGIVGRLVSNDLSAAMVSAELIENDPVTDERIDYIDIARLLDEKVRVPFSDDVATVHIVGFAQAVGDIAAGAVDVLLFFAVAFALSAVLVYVFTHSVRFTALLLTCSLLAVVWTLGLLSLFGYGVDPMSVLVPFLVFAIGVSHGVQIVNATSVASQEGAPAVEAARSAFSRLIVPGAAALASDCIGFLAILFIDVQIIRELALTASLGVAAILFTNLVLLPVLISHVTHREQHRRRMRAAAEAKQVIWNHLSHLATWPAAAAVLGTAAVIAAAGSMAAQQVVVGDVREGVPELRPDSRYNRDATYIAENFAFGVDVLQVIVETVPEACLEFAFVDRIDDFAVRMAQVPGVRSTLSLPQVARQLNASFNEGHPKWRTLPRDSATLVQTVGSVRPDTGLLNPDCSVMPILIFTHDHRVETIDRVVAAVQEYARRHDTEDIRFRLATGNLAIMGATNDLVRDTQVTMLFWVYCAVIALCLLAFRSVRGALCVVLPLALVSVLAYALMAGMEIGLKLSTLPVAAFGVGIGVDYGIYIFSQMRRALHRGASLVEAYREAMAMTGNAVLITGLTLAVGVSTWTFSSLQFQADMGMLLAFMFLANMAGAILLVPALACVLYWRWTPPSRDRG